MPNVSIIIPCYNAARFLRPALDSVFAQTYQDFEIIAVDDGSTDDTTAILERAGPRVRILTHPDKSNRGQAAAWNLGIRNSDGPYIALLDADDLWYPEKMAKQVRALDDDPSIALVYTNGHAINEEGRKLYRLLPPQFREENRCETVLMNCYLSGGSTVLIRRRAFAEVGLFTEELQSADHDMWIRLSERFLFHYLPEPLAAYRKHGAQSSMKRRQWEDGFQILREAGSRYPYPLRVRLARRAVIHYRLGEHDLKNGFPARGVAHWLMAGVFDPVRSMETVRRLAAGRDQFQR